MLGNEEERLCSSKGQINKAKLKQTCAQMVYE